MVRISATCISRFLAPITVFAAAAATLSADRVLGTHQTVIQSLGHFLRKVNVVSGATIMGDGRVALILDISAVVRFADCRIELETAGGLSEAGETVFDSGAGFRDSRPDADL